MKNLGMMAAFSSLYVLVGSLSAQERHTSILAISSNGEETRTIVKLEEFPSVGSPDVSPDGKRIAFDGWQAGGSSGDAQIFIIDIDDGEIQQLGPGAMPTWSADGKYLSYSNYSPRGVFIRSADGVAKKQIDPRGWGIQWSPDGQKLAYTVSGEIVIYNLLTDEKKSFQPRPEDPYNYIYYNTDWSPDSQKICFKGRCQNGEYETAILDISADVPKLTVCFNMGEKGWANEYAWHPDGSRITVVKYGKINRLYEFKPEAEITPTVVPGQPEDRPTTGSCWSPDGKTLYILSRDPK